jgi:hypothetical protein
LLFVEGFIPLWFNSLAQRSQSIDVPILHRAKYFQSGKNRDDGGIPASRFYGSNPQITMTAMNFHKDLRGMGSEPAGRIEVNCGEKLPILVSMIPLTPQNL